MVVTFDRELHRRQAFTSDMRLISDALDEIGTLTGAAVSAETQRRDAMRSIERAQDITEAWSHADFYAKSRYHELGLSIDSLKKLVGSLAGLPGRKALLYVSDGIPMAAGEDMFHLVDQRYPKQSGGKLRANRYNARTRFRELIAQANANRVTFYTLEAAGLDFHSSLSAEQAGSGGATGGSHIDVDFVRDTNRQTTLMMMARDTAAWRPSTPTTLPVRSIAWPRDFNSYYSLGYQPAFREEGRYHDIKIKVKRRGLKLRYRTGYRDKTAETAGRRRHPGVSILWLGAQSSRHRATSHW